jgi:3-deoxy-manno-octulosonate cytidylyltransferase (CMP-KDO synthetase)
MNAVCVIPARYASERFPGKPLVRQTGKFLVQHVFENASRARCFDRVIVATDDTRIASAVDSFGGEARMTRPDHPSGTDRIAEVAAAIEADIIVNVQGDEPDIRPDLLEKLVDLLARNNEAEMATLASRCRDINEVLTPNVVKVVFDRGGRALYFSRSVIPFDRAAFLAGETFPYQNYFKHIGVYAYRRDFLLKFPKMAQTPLEQLESLEQLRAIENGHTILVAEVDYDGRGIDTPSDYQAFVAARKAHTPAE